MWLGFCETRLPTCIRFQLCLLVHVSSFSICHSFGRLEILGETEAPEPPLP